MKYIVLFTLLFIFTACRKAHNKQQIKQYDDIESYNNSVESVANKTIIIADNPVLIEKNKGITLPVASFVYESLDSMPKFQEGETELLRFISDNLKHSIIQGIKNEDRVIVRFIVRKNGMISDIEIIVKSSHKIRDKEAIRLIKSMPKWIPGKLYGFPVSCYYTLPIHFRYSNKKGTN